MARIRSLAACYALAYPTMRQEVALVGAAPTGSLLGRALDDARLVAMAFAHAPRVSPPAIGVVRVAGVPASGVIAAS